MSDKLTTEQAGTILGVSTVQVRRYIGQGWLKAEKIKTPGQGKPPYQYEVDPDSVTELKAARESGQDSRFKVGPPWGKSTPSEAKTGAARKNGRRGGRPRKQTTPRP